MIQTDEHTSRRSAVTAVKSSRPLISTGLPRMVRLPPVSMPTPVCSPSRGALEWGQYPQHTPVTNNNIKLGDNIVAFAEVLRRKGYATGYAGKWHLDGDGKPQWGPKRKFGWEDNRFMFNRGHWKMFADGPNGPRVDQRRMAGLTMYKALMKGFATDCLQLIRS